MFISFPGGRISSKKGGDISQKRSKQGGGHPMKELSPEGRGRSPIVRTFPFNPVSARVNKKVLPLFANRLSGLRLILQEKKMLEERE